MRTTTGAMLGFLVCAAATQAAQAQHHVDECVEAIEISCEAVNDFGYVAEVHGTLVLTGIGPYGTLRTRGELKVKAWFYADGEPAEAQTVTVQGNVAASYLNAEFRSGSGLKSMQLAFQSPMSQLESKDGNTFYQTDCTQSTVSLPEVADLVPLEKLRFTELADGSQRAQISVVNYGSVALTGPAVQVRVGSYEATGSLVQLAGGANTLGPVQQGYIEVQLPAGTVARCGEYEVTVDFAQRLQFGAFDPFANDTGKQTTPCLRWNTTITEESLGTTPDPLIADKTLAAIVSSEVPGRVDGQGNLQLCSACHFPGSTATQRYHPLPGPITPIQNTDGWAWNASGGWADQFLNQSFKPAHLLQLVQRWKQDGAR